MASYIREVEKVIDNHHKSNLLFSLNRKTALFDALTIFEDSCRLGALTSLVLSGDQMHHGLQIRELLDALNVMVYWIYQECKHHDNDFLDREIEHNRMMNAFEVLDEHAKPYSALCSAYISYSRKHLSAIIDEKQKKISFQDNPENRNIIISDLMETVSRDQKNHLRDYFQQKKATQNLVSSITIQNKHLFYSTEDKVWNPFRRMMEEQWSSTSELPEEWEFDSFSVVDYKNFWIAIATLSMIHMVACLNSNTPGACVEEAVMIKTASEFVRIVEEKTDISSERIWAILKYFTYDESLENNDIAYQPFIEIDHDKLALAPHLILASRPERNMVTLIHKKRDKSYFELTNLKEGIMQEEISLIMNGVDNAVVAKNKSLPNELPDVDYAVWDRNSNTVLVCELKWLVEADSTTEVFSRINDLEHGCEQISRILQYANDNTFDFFQRVFGMRLEGERPTIQGCVISKKGIRVENTQIPVISLQSFAELVQREKVMKTVIDSIMSRAYLYKAHSNFSFSSQTVEYAGYVFEIPALVRERDDVRNQKSKKVGWNDRCPCGSGKKYKKCCGRLL